MPRVNFPRLALAAGWSPVTGWMGVSRATPEYAAWLAAQPDVSGSGLLNDALNSPVLWVAENIILPGVGMVTGGPPSEAPPTQEDPPMANGNGFGGVDPWGAGEFGTTDPYPTDTWGSGGPDVNLPSDFGLPTDIGNIVSTVGGISGASQGGGLVPTAQTASAMGAVGGLAMRVPQIVAGAILKLKQALGGGGFLTAGGIASFGSKTWTALTSWAARNPGLSVISTLVGLGLTVEEAAHFLAWGATRKRRRHRRGISYRDMRTTRRTMSRVLSMGQQLRALCGAVPHRSYGRHRHAVVNLPRRR